MKKSVKFSIPIFVIQLLIVASMITVGLLMFDQMPDMMPTHWNVKGEIDDWTSKTTWVWLFPSITLVLALLFPILSRIDPRKEKYTLFRRPWLILQMVFVVFFAYLYFATMYIALHPEILVTPFILGGIGVLFIVIGNYLGKVRQNYFIGIKTPWTLDNEEVWNRTQRVGGWSFMFAGLIIFTEAFIRWQEVWAIFTAIGIAVIIPVLYSYLLHKKIVK